MVELFGFQVPEWVLWILGAAVVLLLVVPILKGFLSELRKK